MPRSPAPIVVFAFNRPDHLARTLRALAACEEAPASRLTIYCDGARRANDEPRVREVRAVAAAVSSFASVEVVARERNLGLAASIIDGVTSQVAQHGRVIVLEDDIVVSPHFLRYMNEGLALYEHDEQVASIHGYTYPVTETLPETFFLRGADCWGWATWARAWRHFEPDGERLLAELRHRKLTHEFDFDGSYPYTRMLEDQVDGRNQSWAIRWHAACYLKDLLTLYPGRSLVENIGNDGSGTHCEPTSDFSQALAVSPIRGERIGVEPSRVGRDAFVSFFRKHRSVAARARRYLERKLHIRR